VLRDALAERQIDSIRIVDEQPNPLPTGLLACQDLDVRLGRREALLDVCLEGFDLHAVTKKVDLAAHLQVPPVRAADD
jgi:hypothetical protein